MIAARDATLTFMVGGNDENFPQAENILRNIGKNVMHCGAVGTGQVLILYYDWHSTQMYNLDYLMKVFLSNQASKKYQKRSDVSPSQHHSQTSNFVGARGCGQGKLGHHFFKN